MQFCVEGIKNTLLSEYSHYIQWIIPGRALQV